MIRGGTDEWRNKLRKYEDADKVPKKNSRSRSPSLNKTMAARPNYLRNARPELKEQ
jgi:hypothetical protein